MGAAAGDNHTRSANLLLSAVMWNDISSNFNNVKKMTHECDNSWIKIKFKILTGLIYFKIRFEKRRCVLKKCTRQNWEY